MKSKLFFILTVIFKLLIGDLYAQNSNLKLKLINYKSKIDSINNSAATEKIYVHLDRSIYLQGDTIWLKPYLFNAAYLTRSDSSKFLIVEVSDSNKVTNRYKFPVNTGAASSFICLDNSYHPGEYVLRAYTNWMKNFSENSFYHKNFIVSSPQSKLLIAELKIRKSGVSDSLLIDLKLNAPNGNVLSSKNIDVYATQNNKQLLKTSLLTNMNGLLQFKLKATSPYTKISVFCSSQNLQSEVTIPINLVDYTKADIQFLPEGGKIIAGQTAHIGFKAVGEDGLGFNISGIILNDDNTEQIAFSSQKNGLGSFDLPVQHHQIYRALIKMPDKSERIIFLPKITNSGFSIAVKNERLNDSIILKINATEDLRQSTPKVILVAKARNVICYAAVVSISKMGVPDIFLSKSLFPTGIVDITIYDENFDPLCGRKTFVNQHDELKIEFANSIAILKDSTRVKINVTKPGHIPATGNFSVSITDDDLLVTDSVSNNNIMTSILLTSDIKGYVETPRYYLENTDNSWKALDNLLLTQGWVDYQPDYKNFKFNHEANLSIYGLVVNYLKKPLPEGKVTLLSKYPPLVLQTTADKSGRYSFNNLPDTENPLYILSGTNKKGQKEKVEVASEDFISVGEPTKKAFYLNSFMPLSDSDFSSNEYININSKTQKQYLRNSSIRYLHEVNIVAKKIVNGSDNLNGAGNADIVLDDKAMAALGKKSLYEILTTKVPGFRVGTYRKKFFYFVRDKGLLITIDGVLLDTDNIGVHNILHPDDADPHDINEYDSYLKSHTVEDIKGIEFMGSGKYTSRYINRFASDDYAPVKLDYAFLEITTRSGNGPNFNRTSDVTLFRPLPVTAPQAFYQPKYFYQQNDDARTTVFWQSNVQTDNNGNAEIFFSPNVNHLKYTVIIEGTDFDGHLGYNMQILNLKPIRAF